MATSTPTNQLEYQLYRVLQRANLLQYYDTFIAQGKGTWKFRYDLKFVNMSEGEINTIVRLPNLFEITRFLTNSSQKFQVNRNGTSSQQYVFCKWGVSCFSSKFFFVKFSFLFCFVQGEMMCNSFVKLARRSSWRSWRSWEWPVSRCMYDAYKKHCRNGQPALVLVR